MPKPQASSGARAVGAGAVVAVVLVGLALALSGAADGAHHVKVLVPAARYFIPGLEVRAAGQKVGEVTKADVTPDNRARLELRIDDDNVWPLPEGTRVRLRFAGTVKMSGRYVELSPGPPGRRPIPEGGVIPPTDVTAPLDFVTTPSEFDDLFGIFDSGTRPNLKAMLDRSGAALRPAAPHLRRTLDTAPAALAQARALLGDLGADQAALDTLVRSSDRVVQSIDSSEPGVGRLLSGAGTTFDALASQSQALQLALERMPVTLASARRTMAHADGTLASLSDLTERLSPGITEVRSLAAPLNSALTTVVDVGPDARQTLATVREAVPDLNSLLDRARQLMPKIGSIGRQAAKQVECIRPYSPEIGGLITSWTGYWGPAEPRGDHFARVVMGTYPFPNGTDMTPEEIDEAFPGITSAFPRPPGQVVAQPWFQPQCGITEDALDPSKDPEAKGRDPMSVYLN